MRGRFTIELGQAGVQDVEAIKLLEDRLHQLDGAVLLLLVVGHGGEGLRVCGGWRIRVLEEVAWKDLAAAWDIYRPSAPTNNAYNPRDKLPNTSLSR